MLVFSFPFFRLNLFSGVLVESESFQGSVASPLVGCKPEGFRTVANTATLFVQLFEESQRIQGQCEQLCYREEKTGVKS